MRSPPVPPWIVSLPSPPDSRSPSAPPSSASSPGPPSMTSAPKPRSRLSSPGPPSRRSIPEAPSRMSSPDAPISVSGPVWPKSESSPAPPERRSPPPLPWMVSAPAVPTRRSGDSVPATTRACALGAATAAITSRVTGRSRGTGIAPVRIGGFPASMTVARSDWTVVRSVPKGGQAPLCSYAITYVRMLGPRVKALREAMGLSLRDLAERSGVSAPMLSQVERGETSPTIALAAKIAEGLELRLSQLLRLDEDGAVTVTRAGNGRMTGGDGAAGHRYEVLTAPLPGRRADLSRHELRPGGATGTPGDPP